MVATRFRSLSRQFVRYLSCIKCPSTSVEILGISPLEIRQYRSKQEIPTRRLANTTSPYGNARLCSFRYPLPTIHLRPNPSRLDNPIPKIQRSQLNNSSPRSITAIRHDDIYSRTLRLRGRFWSRWL